MKERLLLKTTDSSRAEEVPGEKTVLMVQKINLDRHQGQAFGPHPTGMPRSKCRLYSNPSFQFMHTQGSSGSWHTTWVPATHVADQDCVSESLFQPGPVSPGMNI